MTEDSGGQVQTLSMRLTTGLKARLETMREVAALRRGSSVTTSEVAKGLLEAAREDSLEVAEMHGRATGALLAIRNKVDHGRRLSLAEWMFTAHFVQLGTEQYYRNPLRPESWARLLEAFLALYGVRLEGPDRSAVYQSHLGGQISPTPGGSDREVRRAAEDRIERARRGERVHPLVGRALYALLAGERFAGLETIEEALLPFWPVLWRVAARGHFLQTRTPVRDGAEGEDWQGRSTESSDGIPQFRAGPYRLSIVGSATADSLPMVLTLPGDYAAMYSMGQYPQIAEFRAMLDALGPRSVDIGGNVRGRDFWDGEAFFGYVVSGPPSEGFWFRDRHGITLGFPPVGWQQVREMFREAWEHPEVARIWAALEQEYGEL